MEAIALTDSFRRLSERSQQLKREFSAGKARLVRLDEERANLRDTLLRINGAIQVLEEELQAAGQPEAAELEARGSNGNQVAGAETASPAM